MKIIFKIQYLGGIKLSKQKNILSKKDRNKLFYSEITKDYPWFYELLKTKEKLMQEDLVNLDTEKQNFFKDILPNVLNASNNEWKPSHDIYVRVLEGNNRMKCSLCGTKNKYIYYITNKLNENKLNVGSECVKQFGELGEWMKNNGELLKEKQKKIQLKYKLNNDLPGIENTLHKWNEFVTNLPIMLPYKLENKFKSIGLEAKHLYEKIIEGKKYRYYRNEIMKALDEREGLIIEINDYVKEHENKPYVVTDKIIRELKSSRKDKALSMLQEDNGFIKWRTAHRITEKNFIKCLIKDFNKGLESYGISIESYDIKRKGFKIIINSQRRFRFFSKFSGFIMEFGWLIFEPELTEHISFSKFLNLCSLYDSRSYNIAIASFNELLKGYNFNIREIDIDRDRIFLYSDLRGIYVELKLSDFMRKYQSFLFKNEEEYNYEDSRYSSFKSEMQNLFNSSRNKITEQEFKRMKDIERSSRHLRV